jgi:Ca2+-transporting ATPase
MARRKAVVRRLSAVEALGSVTVVATDKTGTLTENRMVVRDLIAADEPAALIAMAVANDADLGSGAGDPVDRALFDAIKARGVDPAALAAARPRQGTVPFDSDAKFMAATVLEDGRPATYLKGAPEVILDRARLTEPDRAGWEDRVRRMAAAGLRVLALGRSGEEPGGPTTLLGMVSFWDPPRAEVGDAVASARAAGVRVIMITGDHPETAATVARAVGIDPAPLLSGPELDRLSAAELAEAVGRVAVFARVTPEHKLRIVTALQTAGEVVAVTGDGVNDAPALKRADVGIAMGQRGSDVSREAADLVLLDDNFATIVAAIEEGRSIYENIQKFIRFLFSTNLSELLVVTIGALAAFLLEIRDAAGSLLLPLTAAQLLWINLITDGAPALALGFDRNPGVLRRPPRDPRESLLDRPSVAFIAWSGAVKAAIALGLLFVLPRFFGQSLEVSRTAGFMFMAAGQLLFAYPARRTELDPPTNPVLHLAVAIGFLVQGATVTVGPLMEAFDATPLSGVAGIATAVAILAAWGAAEGIGRVIHSRRPEGGGAVARVVVQ